MESRQVLTPRTGLPVWPLVTAAVAGAAVALVTIPVWVPVIGASLVGADPKAFWYLSRASAFTGFVLLWLSMASGLLISNKMARIWPGAFTAFDLHQFTSLLGLGFIVLHMLSLLGDHYIGYNLIQLLVPFAAAPYRPLWVALGQIGFYLLIPVTFTFYIRRQIGNYAWRMIHFLSYAVFAMALFHGLSSGTDSSNVWVNWMYWLGAISLTALTIYRVAIKQMSLARQ